MRISSLRVFVGGACVGTLLAAGVAIAQETAEDASSGPSDSPPHRMHRAPIDLAKAKERAEAAFAALDANSDGQITEGEMLGADDADGMMFGERFGKYEHHRRWKDGPGEGRIDRSAETFAALDTDGNGQLSAEEFARLREVRTEQMKKAGFARMDKNGDGVLSKDEFPPFTARLNELDADHDGKVTREEMRAGKARHSRMPDATEAPSTGAEPSSEDG